MPQPARQVQAYVTEADGQETNQAAAIVVPSPAEQSLQQAPGLTGARCRSHGRLATGHMAHLTQRAQLLALHPAHRLTCLRVT